MVLQEMVTAGTAFGGEQSGCSAKSNAAKAEAGSTASVKSEGVAPVVVNEEGGGRQAD